MTEIIESKKGNETIYEYITNDDNGNIVFRKKVNYQTIQIEYENEKYFLLYNSNKEVERDVFKFINVERKDSSFHSKELASTALKILFVFCELFSKDYRDVNLDDAKLLKKFIYGDSIKYGFIVTKLNTTRSSDTVNMYIGVYRAFYNYLNIYNSPFDLKAVKSLKSNRYGEISSDKLKLKDESEISNSRQRRIPMYIKLNEMERILGVIREEYSIREEIIVRLMFECGMRIGEVLGLTLEDINTSPQEIYMNGESCGEIVLRNRLSDEPYQYAKGCIIPKYKRSYKNKEYNTMNIGYEVVNPSMDLLMLIEEYIESVYYSFTDKLKENYIEYSKADMVTNGENLEGGNSYLFINKNGKPLHKSGWNKIIREIFLKSGLKLDTKKRKYNLNHRFRHGYAMFLKKFKNFSREDLMYALRHSNPETVSIYFRPDDEDIFNANTEAVISMYNICPTLRGERDERKN